VTHHLETNFWEKKLGYLAFLFPNLSELEH
jgi:hypothetical protein